MTIRISRVGLALALSLSLAGFGSRAWGEQSPQTSQAGANPSNPALSAGVDPKALGYDQLGTNKSGRVFYSLKKGSSAHAALVAACGDVQKLVGAKPTIAAGFGDQKSDHGAGANFTATVNGTQLKGTILVGVGTNGAAVSIVMALANAAADDWSALLAQLPASIPLKQTSFGGGVGTIGLPDGWKIQNSDNTGTVIVKGPAGQGVSVSVTLLVLGPNSQGARQQAQLAQMARQFGHQPPPAKPVSAYLSPDKAMEGLTNLASQQAVAHGQPADNFKEQLSYQPIQGPDPNVETGLVVYRTTLQTPGNPQDERYMMMASSRRLPAALQGEWGFSYSGVYGPEKTFDRDLPTMIAIWNSYTPDMDALRKAQGQNMMAMQQQFKSFMSQLQAGESATNQFVNQLNQEAMASDRACADEDEVIRGYRKVYDTQTGDEADVNLADSKAIVDALNENDPGRYVQIPLRDEVEPLFR